MVGEKFSLAPHFRLEEEECNFCDGCLGRVSLVNADSTAIYLVPVASLLVKHVLSGAATAAATTNLLLYYAFSAVLIPSPSDEIEIKIYARAGREDRGRRRKIPQRETMYY